MLAQVVVAVGVAGVLAAGVASTVVMQQREIRALNESLARTALATDLTQAVSTESRCSDLVRNGNFLAGRLRFQGNPTEGRPLTSHLRRINEIRRGVAPSTHSNTAVISPADDAISLQINGARSGNTAPGKIVVSLDGDRLVRNLRPVEVPVRVRLDDTSNEVTGCTPANEDEGRSCYGCVGRRGYDEPNLSTPPIIRNRSAGANCPNRGEIAVEAKEGALVPTGYCASLGRDIGFGSPCSNFVQRMMICSNGRFQNFTGAHALTVSN